MEIIFYPSLYLPLFWEFKYHVGGIIICLILILSLIKTNYDRPILLRSYLLVWAIIYLFSGLIFTGVVFGSLLFSTPLILLPVGLIWLAFACIIWGSIYYAWIYSKKSKKIFLTLIHIPLLTMIVFSYLPLGNDRKWEKAKLFVGISTVHHLLFNEESRKNIRNVVLGLATGCECHKIKGQHNTVVNQYYDSGELWKTCQCKNGKVEGLVLIQDKSGKKIEEANLKDNKRNGTYREFENYELIEESNYKEDKLNGFSLDYDKDTGSLWSKVV